MPHETPLILARAHFLLFPCGEILPGAALVGKHLHASFNLAGHAGINDPNDFEAGFFVTMLNANDVAGLQRMSDARDLRAFAADFAGVGVLKEGTAVGIHAPNSDKDLGFDPAFRSFIHELRYLISSVKDLLIITALGDLCRLPT